MVNSQHTGAISKYFRTVEQSLTSKNSVPCATAGVLVNSDMASEDDQHSETGSPAGVTEEHGELLYRDMAREEELDWELSEEANSWETMRRVRSFRGGTSCQKLTFLIILG